MVNLSRLVTSGKNSPSLGYPGGGQTVNEEARSWLEKEYGKNLQWETVSSNFDSCKRAFDGKRTLNFNIGIKNIPLDP
jgi:hypothetical protein